MRKTKKTISDFFSRHHAAQVRSYLLSGSLAIILSLSVVGFSHGVNMNGLMASVAQISRAPEYDADIIMKKTNDSLDIIFGSTATDVDSVEFNIMGDPSHLTNLVSNDSVIISVGDGLYKISRNMGHVTITPGTVISHISVIGESSTLAIADTSFTSSGTTYGLTSKGE